MRRGRLVVHEDFRRQIHVMMSEKSDRCTLRRMKPKDLIGVINALKTSSTTFSISFFLIHSAKVNYIITNKE